MKKACLSFFSVLSVALIALGYWRGSEVPFSEQWPLYEALRTTAAIIFAVVGAWMAIIYPERLKVSFRGDVPAAAASGPRFRTLFAPIVHSSAIISSVLIVGIVAPILKRSSSMIDLSTMRSISYGLLVALTLWQIWTVVLSLVGADIIKTKADADDDRARFMHDRMHMGSTLSKSPED